MLDVVINFRTSYVDDITGTEVTDLKEIAKQYLKSRFWVDILASFPLDFISYAFSNKDSSFSLQLISLLKLVRVLRLSRLITYLNLKNDLKMTFKLFKLIFFLILYIHCLGWAWFYIVKQNEKWIPPLDYVFITTDIYDWSGFHQYWSSVYHAMLILGGNDVGPRGEFQLVFVTIMLILAAIINANIFGNMGLLIQSLNRKASVFQEKLDYITETMKNFNIPVDIQEDVKNYITFTQTKLDLQKDLDQFLNMISPSLRKRVTQYIFYNSISKNPVFSKEEEVLSVIMQDFKNRLFLPEDQIIRQNEVGDSLFFL